jgi:Rrf2 family transcriptional regulator, cysteine metabolism repressor
VKLSVKSDYAMRAVFGLARHYASGRALRVELLAAEQGIPANYLTQILIELKSQQIVKSVRGKVGGYLLAKPPGEITVGDVLRCIHGALLDTPAMNDPQCPPELRGVWQQLSTVFNDTANSMNFQKLTEQATEYSI